MQANDVMLIPNPHAELRFTHEADVISAITVRAPVKGKPLMVTSIMREKEPEVFSTLLVSAIRRATLRLGSEAAAVKGRLAEIGFLLPENQVSNPVRFSCDIDDPPIHLIPRRAVCNDMCDPVEEDLLVNPTLRYLRDSGPEMPEPKHLPNRFRTDRSWILLEDPMLSVPCVYSAGGEAEGWFDKLVSGEPSPATLPVDARQRLCSAGVLGSAAKMAEGRKWRTRLVADARLQLQQDRYTVLPQIVRPLQLAALRRYYQELIGEGFLRLGDQDWSDRYFTDSDSIAHFFHRQFTGLVSEIAGERVRPTFLFFASYQPGSELPPHRDREQCEYSMSVLIDHSPEPDDLSPWPIYLQPPGAKSGIPIRLGIGDAALYRGREVTHYRYPLGEGQHSSLWFFFYVGESFVGPLV
jgi:hypothetical protein